MKINITRLLFRVLWIIISAVTLFSAYRYFVDISLFIIMGLTLLLIYFLLDPAFRTFKTNNQDIISLAVTLSTTLLGVYLALQLTNKSTEKIERNKTIALLRAAQTDINLAHGFLFEHIKLMDKQFRNKPDSLFLKLKESRNNNNLQSYTKPSIINTLLENDMVLNYLHPRIITQLTNMNINFNTTHQGLNLMGLGDYNSFRRLAVSTTFYYGAMHKILEEQIKLLENEINAVQLEESINIIISELKGNLPKATTVH